MLNTKEAIFEKLKEILEQLFEVDPNTVKLETNLYEELGLDSIDAVDLIVHLQTITKKKFNPEQFKSVRTVSDVIKIIDIELNQ